MITLIMNMTGQYPQLIEEAIGSIINQSTREFKLIIVNVNKNPVVCDFKDLNVEILNLKPFDHFKEQVVTGLKAVKTRWWTFVDSDDYLLSDHVSNMLERLHHYYLYTSPMALGSWSVLKEYKGNFDYLTHGCMTRFLFEKMPDSFYGRMSDKHKTENGFEHRIFEYPMWNKILFNQNPTYIYRVRDDGMHVRRPTEIKPLPTLIPKRNIILEKESINYIGHTWVKYLESYIESIKK